MRQIYIVNATQYVISESHPEGVFSTMPDYPKTFDSRNYPAADGKQIMRGNIGVFPDMTPEPEQEQEEQNV